jgi:hypothetical protein
LFGGPHHEEMRGMALIADVCPNCLSRESTAVRKQVSETPLRYHDDPESL